MERVGEIGLIAPGVVIRRRNRWLFRETEGYLSNSLAEQ